MDVASRAARAVRPHLLPLAIVSALLAGGGAQADMLTSSGYSQNFDSMGTTGTAPPLDWSVWTGPSGTSNATWTAATGVPASGVASMVLAGTPLVATNSPSGTNNDGFNSANVATSPVDTTDRVLATSPTLVSGAALQVTLTNDTGSALTGVNLSFDTDRLTAATAANELPGYWLFYSTNGTSWTNVSSLNPTIATVPNTVGVTSTSGTVTFANAIAAGSNVELRWVDDNAQQTSPDQIIGLNNVAITPVPLPASAWLLCGGLGAFGVFGRGKKRRSPLPV
jgi:hypothetical protein